MWKNQVCALVGLKCKKEFYCNRKTEIMSRFQSGGISNYYFFQNSNKQRPKAQNNKDKETSTASGKMFLGN